MTHHPAVVLLLLLVAACGVHAIFDCPHDTSRCQNYSTCDRTDALYRSGHLCDRFPWYTGRAPVTKWSWHLQPVRRVGALACS
jgi:hypothetical protein